MNILVVDDSEDTRDLTAAILHGAGYANVDTAASADEALRLLGIGNGGAVKPVDIVLLDVVMPGTDGIEACALIRRQQGYEDLPIIMVTALNDMDSLSNAFVA